MGPRKTCRRACWNPSLMILSLRDVQIQGKRRLAFTFNICIDIVCLATETQSSQYFSPVKHHWATDFSVFSLNKQGQKLFGLLDLVHSVRFGPVVRSWRKTQQSSRARWSNSPVSIKVNISEIKETFPHGDPVWTHYLIHTGRQQIQSTQDRLQPEEVCCLIHQFQSDFTKIVCDFLKVKV